MIATWNEEIEGKLNLSQYWQQDELFCLRMNYKQGTLFFEITDKTGSIYTFRERSSGLRFFLSYYIQAMALSRSSTDRDTVVLMDEPDSFLSSQGQRNLLAVFESLVRSETSTESTQLVYTTHSPFLINRNFPRRIRLVRKGDAEEGTQFIEQPGVRRYEPVRSALGIDCAQTLFMGDTNVLLEGPSDQYLISELIRSFATMDSIDEFLDLNSVTVLSAESAPGIEKVISASQWGDEPIPTAVVILDNDEGGRRVRDRIIGKARNCKKLVEPDLVALISEVLGDSSDGQAIVTIDDLVLSKLYAIAVERYINRWYPDIFESKKQEIAKAARDGSFGAHGVVAGANDIFRRLVFENEDNYDKVGVNEEVISLVQDKVDGGQTALIMELERRIRSLCEFLRRKIAMSRVAERRRTGKQAVQRIISDFLVRYRRGANLFSVILLNERLEREADALGEDGMELGAAVAALLARAKDLRAAGQVSLKDESWEHWRRALVRLRKNPLQPGTVEPERDAGEGEADKEQG